MAKSIVAKAYREFIDRCEAQAKALDMSLPKGLCIFIAGLEENFDALPNVMMQLTMRDKGTAQAVFTGFSNGKVTVSRLLREICNGFQNIDAQWHLTYDKLASGEARIMIDWAVTSTVEQKKDAGLPPFLYGRSELKEKDVPVFPSLPVVTRQEVERYLSAQGWIKMQDAKDEEGPPELVNFGPVDDEPPALVECSDDDHNDLPGLEEVCKPTFGSLAVTREVPQAVGEPGPSTTADLEAVERAQRVLRLLFRHNPDYARMTMLGQVLGVKSDDVVPAVSDAITNFKRCTELTPKLKIVESMLNTLCH